ncbi:MAG: CehA/McbA family metallohydrolase, partial [Pirellulaceae bacterium]
MLTFSPEPVRPVAGSRLLWNSFGTPWRSSIVRLAAVCFALALAGCSRVWAAVPSVPRGGEFEIRVVDAETRQPIAVNIFLRDARGRPVKARPQPFWKDHFSFLDSVVLKLRAGQYTFEMERGPEYKLRAGSFEIHPGATDNTEVVMERFVDMKQQGWWSGDLHIHRPPADIPLLMLAQDLHVAPVITWWNETNAWKDQDLPDPAVVQFDGDRFYHLLAGEDERGGGALLYFQLASPLPLPAREAQEYPPMSQFLELARPQAGLHVDIEKPFWWEMPTWVALGMVDSIGLAHNHLWRNGMLDNEAWGKPRDKVFYPSPRGNGYWSQDIYYHLLNCGLRIPPSAGSASGVLDNPVGYNRVYVHCGETLTYDAWWEGLRAGRVVVTNGPLLRPRVNGELPGHVFRGKLGEVIELNVQLDLALRDPVDYLEVVQNGKVIQEVRLEEYRHRKGSLPPVICEESGWLLVRA